MLAVGPDDLGEELGSTFHCPHCGKEHPVEYGETEQPDGTMKKTKAIAYYKCGDTAYLAGIDGRMLKPR